MAVNSIAGATTYVSSDQKTKEYSNNMDKDAFLNILVTQLRNQNPLQPMEDKDFIAQMAQFSSLEQAQNTNKTAQLNSAYNMINKTVKANHTNTDTNANEEIIGVVTKVRVDNDKIYLMLDGIKNNKATTEEVLLDEVSEVTDSVSPIETSQNMKMSSAFSMLNKEVKALHYDSSTGKNIEIAGTVDKVRLSNGKILLSVNDSDILLEEVYEIQ